MAQTVIVGNIIDLWIEVYGKRQKIYRSEGKRWMVGLWGQPYSIVVQNKTNGRLEIIESVDGRNVLEDEPADPVVNRGMVIGTFPAWVNKGWRLSNTLTADFVFTDPTEAIATQATGSSANVGVIAVAVYREYEPPRPQRPYWEGSRMRGGSRSFTAGLESLGSKGLTRGGDMGTGMGQTRTDKVGSTSFTRRTSQPEESFVIQYRSQQWLLDRGILDRDDDEEPNPWPGNSDTGYGQYRKTR